MSGWIKLPLLLIAAICRKKTCLHFKKCTYNERVIKIIDPVSNIKKENKQCTNPCFHILRLQSQYSFLSCCLTGSGSVIITGRKGEIQSLGYPNPYPAHLQSSWKISVPNGFLVKLQITDLAIPGETGMCNYDKLVITDAYSTLGEFSPFLHGIGALIEKVKLTPTYFLSFNSQ